MTAITLALFNALTGILESLEDAKRNNPEAYCEFTNEIAVDLNIACETANKLLKDMVQNEPTS